MSFSKRGGWESQSSQAHWQTRRDDWARGTDLSTSSEADGYIGASPEKGNQESEEAGSHVS